MAVRIAAAVDFGGTKLMVGLVDEAGRIHAHHSLPTPQGGPEAVADAVSRVIQILVLQERLVLQDLVGIGATVPGLADTETGVLRYAPAHGWRDVPFAHMLTDRLGLIARISNDVNACALAEQRFGAGKGVSNLIWITISTGIGGGLILNGQLYTGGGFAGEIGHFVVEEGGPLCGCGHMGCLEAVASGPAIARRAGEAGLLVSDSISVARLAREGNLIAVEVMAQTGRYLGRAVACCLNMLDPDLIVFGGGVSRSLDLILPALQATVSERTIRIDRQRVPPMTVTALGYEAALIGAGALVL